MADAMADRAAAAVALDAGDPDFAAERALASAAPRTRSAPPSRPPSRGRSRAARSRRPASPSVQSSSCERAAAELHACGALRYRAAAERELRRLGHRVHRRTRPGKADGVGVASLTERELQVARLVVDRRTNPEIADALFLSPKTVETHMRNIFRKLEVSSRVEVARAVERSVAY